VSISRLCRTSWNNHQRLPVFAGQAGPQAQPIAVVWHDGRYLAGVQHDDTASTNPTAMDVDRLPRSGTEAVLLIGDGTHAFDLRAIYVGGLVTATAPTPGAPEGHRWFEVAAETTAAWDYARPRDADDDESEAQEICRPPLMS
jgi:hypothetical protein